MRAISYILVFLFSLATLGEFADRDIMVRASGQHLTAVSDPMSVASVDPNKAPSELNHHLAGWALMGVGFLVLVSFLYPNVRALRYFWPALFLLMGLFLALWSDAEIWPRGNINWAWLLQHDREAGMHKIYALLLMAIGACEYLRASGSLNRFWRAWAFPMLAVVGAASLLVHDHTARSGATSPEARAYLVNPAVGPDGNSPISPAPDPMPGLDHSTTALDHSGMPMDQSSMEHSSMLLVEREHFWFMIIGLGVALFKLISDGEFWRRRFVPYVWPSGMMLLGILLVLYQE